MTTLLLVRHGESIGDITSTGRENYELGLSPRGRAQAELLSDFLYLYSGRVRAVYMSTRARAVETGEIMAKHLGVTPIRVPEFQEAALGEWEGKDEREIMEKYPEQIKEFSQDPEKFIIPGGESIAAVKKRLEGKLQEILSFSPNETVIVVSHWVIIAMAVCIIEKYPLSSFPQFKTRHCSITAYVGTWPIVQRIDFDKQIVVDSRPKREKESRFLAVSFSAASACLLGSYFSLSRFSLTDPTSMALTVSGMHYFRYLLKYYFIWVPRLPSWSTKHDLLNMAIFICGCASILFSNVLPLFLAIWCVMYALVFYKEKIALSECLFFTAPGMMSMLRRKRERALPKALMYFSLLPISYIVGSVTLHGWISINLTICYFLGVFAIWALVRDIRFYLSEKWWTL